MPPSDSERKTLIIAGSIVVGLALMGVIIGSLAHGRRAASGSEVTIRASEIHGPVTILEAASLLRSSSNDADRVSAWISNRWLEWADTTFHMTSEERQQSMSKMLDDSAKLLESSGIMKRLTDERAQLRDVIHATQADESGPEVREKLIKAYGIYGEMVSAAISPNGSFDSYHDQTSRVASEMNRALSELSVMIGSSIKSAQSDPLVLPKDGTAPLQ